MCHDHPSNAPGTDPLAHLRIAGRREAIRAARRDVGAAANSVEQSALAVSEAMRPIIIGDHDTVAWARGDWRRITIAIAHAEQHMERLRACLDNLRNDAGRAARLEQEADVDAA